MRVWLEVGIDCAPFGPRPDAYVGKVLAGTGLNVPDQSPAKLFGAWVWKVAAPDLEVARAAKTVMLERLARLYEDDLIRGAVVSVETDEPAEA